MTADTASLPDWTRLLRAPRVHFPRARQAVEELLDRPPATMFPALKEGLALLSEEEFRFFTGALTLLVRDASGQSWADAQAWSSMASGPYDEGWRVGSVEPWWDGADPRDRYRFLLGYAWLLWHERHQESVVVPHSFRCRCGQPQTLVCVSPGHPALACVIQVRDGLECAACGTRRDLCVCARCSARTTVEAEGSLGPRVVVLDDASKARYLALLARRLDEAAAEAVTAPGPQVVATLRQVIDGLVELEQSGEPDAPIYRLRDLGEREAGAREQLAMVLERLHRLAEAADQYRDAAERYLDVGALEAATRCRLLAAALHGELDEQGEELHRRVTDLISSPLARAAILVAAADWDSSRGRTEAAHAGLQRALHELEDAGYRPLSRLGPDRPARELGQAWALVRRAYTGLLQAGMDDYARLAGYREQLKVMSQVDRLLAEPRPSQPAPPATAGP